MIALITPTGGRPKQFALCNRWMRQQTYKGKVLWIVVDDCLSITSEIKIPLPENWCVVHKYPRPVWKDGQNTQSRNLQAGLNVVKGFPEKQIDSIFIIEDDDYYSPTYLEEMTKILDGKDLIGECCTLYYNVAVRKYHRNSNRNHSSLFQTAFKPSLISTFEKSFGGKFIDIKFFALAKEEKRNIYLFGEKDLAIGIKGMVGRRGIGSGHSIAQMRSRAKDEQFVELQKYLKDDYIHYV